MNQEMKNLAGEILRRIEQAEQMEPAGSYEQSKYLTSRLWIEWPSIRAILTVLSRPS